MTKHLPLRDVEARAAAARRQQQASLRSFPVVSASVDIASLPVDPDEPTPSFDEVMALVGVEVWPLPEFSHEQFLRDVGQSSWLADRESQLHELIIEQEARRRAQDELRNRPRDASGKFLPREEVKSS